MNSLFEAVDKINLFEDNIEGGHLTDEEFEKQNGFSREQYAKSYYPAYLDYHNLEDNKENYIKFGMQNAEECMKKWDMSAEEFEKYIKDNADAHYDPNDSESMQCEYCGKDNNSADPNELCQDCKEMFGHDYFDEL